MNSSSFFLIFLIVFPSFSKESPSADMKVNSKSAVVKEKLAVFGINWLGKENWNLINEIDSQNSKAIAISTPGKRIEFTKITGVSPSQFQHRCDNEIKLAKIVKQAAVTPYSGEIAIKSACLTFTTPSPRDWFLSESDKNSRIVEVFSGETSRSGATQCEAEATFAVMTRIFYDPKVTTVFKIKMFQAKKDQSMTDAFKHIKSDLDALVLMGKK